MQNKSSSKPTTKTTEKAKETRPSRNSVRPTAQQSGQQTDAKANFTKKLSIAKCVYDYSDESKDQKLKADRLQAINDLIELFSDQRNVANLFIPNIEYVMEMITKNIFRPLPSLKKNNINVNIGDTGIDQDEVESDPSWIHIKGVYDIFLQFILSDAHDGKVFRVFITTNFIQEFLQLFDSEEVEERDFLKNILHKLYSKLVPRRKMIRKAITDCFQILIHEIHKFNGASELLDILASIISGFATPLREEHVIFFKTIIIPLHKVQTYNLYYDNLVRCSMLFLTKDGSLSIPLLEGMLRYWPFANFLKETYFLQELPEMFEFFDTEKLKPLIPKLFKRILKCIVGSHLQVADRAMCLFENDNFISIIKNYKTVTFNMLVPVVTELAENHWHKMLQDSLLALKEILQKLDSATFEQALENAKTKKYDKMYRLTQTTETRNAIEQKWKAYTQLAKSKNSKFVEPILPFKEDTILGDYNDVYRSIYDKERYLNM